MVRAPTGSPFVNRPLLTGPVSYSSQASDELARTTYIVQHETGDVHTCGPIFDFMSLGRRAYRHVASSTPLAGDHVWVSEDFLATTFRRFANGQRQQQRYESRAPGPLESRRRLAKRRNTSLASVAGSGQWGDIACLFGKNGKEHMKWTDRRAQVQDRGKNSWIWASERTGYIMEGNRG